jgi:hypothetical protein
LQYELSDLKGIVAALAAHMQALLLQNSMQQG